VKDKRKWELLSTPTSSLKKKPQPKTMYEQSKEQKKQISLE
jgi:hypothetical protein